MLGQNAVVFKVNGRMLFLSQANHSRDVSLSSLLVSLGAVITAGRWKGLIWRGRERSLTYHVRIYPSIQGLPERCASIFAFDLEIRIALEDETHHI